MKFKLKKMLALSASALILTACGFHLKGSMPYDHLPATTWQVDGGELQNALELAIYQSQGKIVSSLPQAQLKITNITKFKDIYTITRGAKLNEYLLSMSVTAQAYHADGRAWGNPMTAKISRSMAYSDSAVLSKVEDETTIWQEMRREIAGQIVRQLGFIGKNQTNQTNPTE